jgi:hypothetical protein
MRDLWQTTNVEHGAKRALATNPKKLSVMGIKKLLDRAIWEQNLRQPLQKGTRLHEWKTTHSYRKFFKSRAEQVMKPLNVELLMGHSSGISDSYWRPTEQEVLDDYLKAVVLLTVNTDQKAAIQLQKQVAEITERNEQANYEILGKLAQREKETEAMKKQISLQEEQQQRTNDMLNKAVAAMAKMLCTTVENAAADTEEQKQQKADKIERIKMLSAFVTGQHSYIGP